jgi:NAD(P)-dependent dehydrogenase (short-subunit alcohol dehydrogenase family)
MGGEMEKAKNQTILITGGGTGIGFTLANRFLQEGASVVICGRREEVLNKAVVEISATGERIIGVPADISKEKDVVNLFEQTIKWTNRLDVLVNNAGAMRINKSPQETSLEEWESVIDTNINGTFLCCREAAKIMIKQKRGRIINISSISGTIVNKYFHGGSYEVSKAAINMLTKVFAAEWAPFNITVNAIAPGYYDTQPNRDFFKRESGLLEKITELIPQKKLGDLEELSDLVVSIATTRSNYLTGTVIPVDGGYTLW